MISGKLAFPRLKALGLAAKLLMALAMWCVAAPAMASLTASIQVPSDLQTPTNPLVYYSSTIQPGETTALRITITNNNPSQPISNTTFNLDLSSSGLRIVNGPSVGPGAGNGGVESYTCTPGGGSATVTNGTTAGIGAVVGSSTISMTNGTIPIADPGGGTSGQCVLVVRVTSTVVGGNTATIPAGGVQGTDGSPQQNAPPQADQTITVFSFTQPSVTKSFGAATAILGQPVTLTIRITNNSAAATLPLNGVGDSPAYGLIDNLSNYGFQLAPTPNPTADANCGGPTFVATSNGTDFRVVGGTIPASAMCTITVQVVATTTGSLTNTINRTTDFKTVRGVAAVGDATANLTATASLALSFAFANDPVPDSQPSTFSTTITNSTATTIVMNGTFTDIPGKYDNITPTPAGDPNVNGLLITGLVSNGCGGTLLIDPGQQFYTLSGASFAPGVSCTMTFNYIGVVIQPADNSMNLTHYASPIPNVQGVVAGGNPLSINVWKSLATDKSILQPADGVVRAGQAVQFQLATGNYAADGKVVIVDHLQPGLTFVQNATYPVVGTGATADCANVTVDFSDPQNPVFTYPNFPGATSVNARSCILTFYAMAGPTPPAAFTNGLAACDIRFGPAAGVGTGSCATRDTFPVAGTFAAPIAINEAFSVPTTTAGSTITLTYTLRNFGASTLSNAAFSDTLPTAVGGGALQVAATPGVVSDCGGTVTAAANSNVISLTGGTVGPRDGGGFGPNEGKCTITVNVTAPAGIYQNDIAASAFTGDQSQANGTTAPSTSAAQIVTAQATFTSALAATKSFAPATVAPGGTSQVTIRLENSGGTSYTGVSVTDPLPTGMHIAPSPGAQTSCGGTPAFTATALANSFSVTGVVVPASSSCTVQFNIVTDSPQVGNWVNTIPAGQITANGGISNTNPVVGTLNNGNSGAVTVTNTVTPGALVAPGQTAVLMVTLTNSGGVTLTGVGVTDYLTLDGTAGGGVTGMVIASTPGQQTTCAGGIVDVLTTTSFRLRNATIPPGNVSCTFQVNVTLLELGTRPNIIPIGAVTSNEGITNTSVGNTSLSLSGQIGVVKSFFPALVKPNVPSRLTIRLYNLIQSSVTGISFTDSLQSPLAFAPLPNATTTCAGASINLGASSIGITGGQLAASTGSAVSCVVEVNVVGPTTGSYPNTIPISAVAGTNTNDNGGSGIPTPVQNVVAADATLQVRSPVAIAKAFANPTRAPGQPNTMTITLSNPNNIVLTGSYLTDNLPANVTVALTPLASTTCGGTVIATQSATSVSLAGGSIPASTSCTITVDVVSNTSGSYTNTIPVSALTTLIGITNEVLASASFTVTELVDVTKVFAPAAIAPGATSTLTITLQNNSNAVGTLTSIFTDTLPTTPGPVTVAAGALGGTCTLASVTAALGSGTVSYASGATVPQGGCTIIVPVTGSTVGVHTNTIAPNALQTTVGANPSPRTATLTIGSPVSVAKAFSPVSIPANGTSSLTITLGNTSAGPATLSSIFTDTLPTTPGPIVVANPATVTGTCTTASVTATAGAGTITYASGATVPAGGCTIIVPVTGATAGVHTNTIPISALATDIGANPAVATATLTIGSVGVAKAFSPTTIVSGGTSTLTINLQNNTAGAATLTSVFTDTLPTTPGPVTVAGAATGTCTLASVTATLGAGAVTYANGASVPQGGCTIIVPVTATATGAHVNTIPISALQTTAGVNTTPTTSTLTVSPPSVSVSGKVYDDINDNGVVDGGETGIPGVSIRLTGTDSTGAAVNVTTTTDASGDYQFTVPPSNPSGYTITETQPVNADGKTTAPTGAATSSKPVATAGADLITGVVVAATPLSGYNFGEHSSGATVGGVVYFDANNDGVKGGAELGIAGVTVRLTGTNASGVAISRTTTTDAAGAYVFAGLAPSNPAGYLITETQPSDYVDGLTTIASGNPGTATSTKPVAAGGNDVIAAVVVAANSSITGYNFGERRVGGVVSGYVFTDANNDGVRQSTDTGIADVIVRLTGVDINGSAVSLVRTTGADGTFQFDNVPASNAAGYVLTEEQPSGVNDGKTVVTSGNPGQAASTKPVNVGDTDRVTGVVTTISSNLTEYRFGETPIPLLKPPIVNGYVYLDRAHSRVRPTDGSVEGQLGWTVELRQNGTVICTTTTDGKGFYQFDNLHCPGYEISGLPTGPGFSITFSKDGNNLPAVPTSGGNRGQVPPTGGEILNITLNPSDKVVEQNLPLDPAGVVYNTVTRQPVAGAVVSISGPPGFVPATHLVGGLEAQVQTVGADGLYQFLLQNGFPSGVYTLSVVAPTGYLPAPSSTLPACVGTLNVGLIPNPALIQSTDLAPAASVPHPTDVNNCQGLIPGGSNTSQYYFNFFITNGGSAPILNNNIPVDPIASGALMVTKTTPMVNVARGALVPYTITATNPATTSLNSAAIHDQLPAGFKYIDGSATRNGQRVTPTVVGRDVTWPAETFAPKEKKTYTLILVVGAGVGDGDYVNRAWIDAAGGILSNIATATVRIVPDPTLDCPDIIGKVFDDRNANGYQDDGEPGIPAVRMATPNGLLVTSDAEGRFHVPCPATPNMDRGSNFVMKLDERSLPSGFRVTTENPRDVRITRGKMTKLNFGATIHRVVRLELAAAAFQGDSVTLQPNWRAELDKLPSRLAERPSIVRIAYKRGAESSDLATKRAREIRNLIQDAWKQEHGRYALVIEIEGER